VSISERYRQQYPWRPWGRIYPLLGNLSGQVVLDLGCGIGDQAADLARLGAEVIGVELNESLVKVARAREIPRARFVCADLSSLALNDVHANGIWLGFAAAYFPRIGEELDRWSRSLVPGGWIAVTEVDDLFGHEPLEPRYRELIEEYYARSLQEGLHAFRSRDRVHEALVSRGWQIEVQDEFPDLELSFEGLADDAVLSAWRARLDLMMPRFVERFGEDASAFRDAFLDCLASKTHRSQARVWFLMARRP